MDDETRAYFEEIRRELSALRGEVGTLHGEVGTLHGEVGTLRGELTQLREESSARFAAVDVRFDAVDARITSEAAQTRRQFGVIAEELQRRLAIVAETTLDNGRRVTENTTAIDGLRENAGLHLAELRVAIADLRAHR